jgi:hypothetical protein
MTMRFACVVTLLLASALAAAAPSAAQASRIEGQWQLVPGESDDARAKLDAAVPRRVPGRAGIGGDGRAFPGGRPGNVPGFIPRGGRGDDIDRMRGVLTLEFLEPVVQMTIIQRDDEILLQDASENTVVLRPDGKKWKRAGGAVETRTRWKGADLVCESSADQSRLTTTYTLVTPGRLEVRHRFRPPVGADAMAKRVYDRVTQSAPPKTSDTP